MPLVVVAAWIGQVLAATITGVTVEQSSSTNDLVEVAVAFSGSSNEVVETECMFAATNNATKAALEIAHLTAVGGAVGGGSAWVRKFVWNAAADIGEVKIDDVTFTVAMSVLPGELGGVQLWEDGPYWAECNVGAARAEDCGYYFWWGDTVGYEANTNGATWERSEEWRGVTWVSNQVERTGGSPFNNLCPTSSRAVSKLQEMGYIDSDLRLVAKHDAATVRLGAPWRMPTDVEFSNLVEKCDTVWTTSNGVCGRLVTGRGAYSSKSIFLPAAGYGSGYDLFSPGLIGGYWSSMSVPDSSYYALCLSFNLIDFAFGRKDKDYYRYLGQSVRPLREFTQHPWEPVISSWATVHLAMDFRKVTATPVITVTGQTAWSKTKVEISSATPEAEIRYTTTGDDINSHSPRYAGPFYVNESCTVKAMAVCAGFANSEVASFEITKPRSIGDTMGAPGHVFTTCGDAEFFPETPKTDETAPADEVMRSGDIGNSAGWGTYTRSELSTVVHGPGTLTFKWCSSCEKDDAYEWDHAEFIVDGEVVARINGITDWEEVSHAITDAGEHRLVWAYLKDDADKDGDDCLRVACYSWAPGELWTHETEVAVPYSWLQEQFPEVIDDCDAYEALAQETAANGHKVWECFVAGLDAKDAESALRAFIELKDGKVCISWNPNLNTNEVTRIYRVWGRACLDQGGWATPPKSVDRFFKVEVTMPTGAAGEKSAVSGEGFEP